MGPEASTNLLHYGSLNVLPPLLHLNGHVDTYHVADYERGSYVDAPVAAAPGHFGVFETCLGEELTCPL